ncbi:DNA polymerase I [Patescibacteria group bacterium]|nr:DNA polymerase I [Patescibacteria group bacterium]
MPKRQKFMIVDGNAILHRAWHALPPMTSKDGTVVNAVYGFVTTFLKAIKELKPDFVAVTFDRKEKTFRHEEFKEYKAGRVKQPDELYAQIPIVKEVLSAMNIKIFEKVGFEADDVIGTLCEKHQVDKENVLSIIVTGDLDALQLVDENTEVYTLRKGMSDTVIFNEKAVKEKYDGLLPSQMTDYKGLRGDPSDNISGVPGVGEKTAIIILKEFGTIENIYEKLKVKNPQTELKERIVTKLLENEDIARQSKKLATIIRDVPLDFKLRECALQPYRKTAVFEIFQQLEFTSLLSRLPDFGEAETVEEKKKINNHQYIHVSQVEEFEKFLAELKKEKLFVFDTETSGLDIFESKLLGISFCWKERLAYYVEANPIFLEKLKPIFADKKIKKCGHNLKFDAEILKQLDFEIENLFFDTMIASYLLSPGTRTHNLDNLVFREFGYQMTKIADLIGKGKGQVTMDFVDVKKVADYSCEDADYTFRLVEKLKKFLEKNELWELFEKIEMPIVEVLIEMELNGIKIDSDHLKEISKKVKQRINILTKKIYKSAGKEFNISSPAQLKEILFEDLKLSSAGIGKTKTGISTAAAELEKLRDLHPIIEMIEEYRELSKLQSTYIDALPKLINKKTGRVHTDFNQTVTATGRFSSSNPNLQNIPIRKKLGKDIRRAFVSARGYKLISADYSQVELRVIACLSKDKNMMEVFRKEEDIHTVTAAKIFEVPLEEVTKEMRSAAKEVNFGVIYGMGAYGLAARKKISREKAKEFIDKYFQNFSKVKEYIEELKDEASEKGYAVTMFGRRRYLPEIDSGVQQVRASAERMAVNMPIQGTAADLLKIAMIEVYKELKEKSPKSKLLLTVHDELVIEVPNDEVDKVAKIVDEKMEKIHQLCVPIRVDTEFGNNWQDLKPLY